MGTAPPSWPAAGRNSSSGDGGGGGSGGPGGSSMALPPLGPHQVGTRPVRKAHTSYKPHTLREYRELMTATTGVVLPPVAGRGPPASGGVSSQRGANPAELRLRELLDKRAARERAASYGQHG